MDRFWLRPMLDGLLVASDVGRLLGWRGGCRLRDPPAVMASALEKLAFGWKVAFYRWHVGRGSVRWISVFRRPRGKWFVGPKGHAVLSRRRA